MAGRAEVVSRPVAAVHAGISLVSDIRTAIGGCSRCTAAAVISLVAEPSRLDQPGGCTECTCNRTRTNLILNGIRLDGYTHAATFPGFVTDVDSVFPSSLCVDGSCEPRLIVIER